MKQNRILLLAVISLVAVGFWLGYARFQPEMKGRTVWLDSLDLSLADQVAGSALPGKSM